MSNFLTSYWWLLLLVLMAWTMVWKGLALWRAARRGDKVWFVVLMVVNSVGLLDLGYYLYTNRSKNDQASTLAT